jgi:hypothetical protein
VIWARGKWASADVKFAGYKNFERAVRLGQPVLDGHQASIRTSFLNLQRERQPRDRNDEGYKRETYKEKGETKTKVDAKGDYYTSGYEGGGYTGYDEAKAHGYDKGYKYGMQEIEAGIYYGQDYNYGKKDYEKKDYNYQQGHSEKPKADKSDYHYHGQYYGGSKYWENDQYAEKYSNAESYPKTQAGQYSHNTDKASYSKYDGHAGKKSHQQDYQYHAAGEQSGYYNDNAEKQYSHKRGNPKEDYDNKRGYGKDSHKHDYQEYGGYGYKGHGKDDYGYQDYNYDYSSARKDEKDFAKDKKTHRDEVYGEKQYAHQGYKAEGADRKQSKYGDGYDRQSYYKDDQRYQRDPRQQPDGYSSAHSKANRKKEAGVDHQDYKKYDYRQDLGHYDYNNPPTNQKAEDSKGQPNPVQKKKGFDCTGGSSFMVREVTGPEAAEKPRQADHFTPSGPIMAESGYQKGLVTPASDSNIRFPASGSTEQYALKNRGSQEPTAYGGRIQENYWGTSKFPNKVPLLDQIRPEPMVKPAKVVEPKKAVEKYSYYGATANDIAKQFTQSKTESVDSAPHASKIKSRPEGADLRKISEEDNEAEWGPRKFYNTAKNGSSALKKELSP